MKRQDIRIILVTQFPSAETVISCIFASNIWCLTLRWEFTRDEGYQTYETLYFQRMILPYVHIPKRSKVTNLNVLLPFVRLHNNRLLFGPRLLLRLMMRMSVLVGLW